MLGGSRTFTTLKILVDLLNDSEPRVQFFALQSIAQWPPYAGLDGDGHYKVAFDAIVQLARQQGEKDPYLRHALANALSAVFSGSWGKPELDESPAAHDRAAGAPVVSSKTIGGGRIQFRRDRRYVFLRQRPKDCRRDGAGDSRFEREKRFAQVGRDSDEAECSSRSPLPRPQRSLSPGQTGECRSA